MGRVQEAPGTTRRGLVSRARLQAALRGDPDARVTVVVAPAGYGKTTVLAEWADADPRPAAWVTIERHHNDPAALVGQIATALDALEPLGVGVFDALRSPQPSLETLLPRLRDALTDREPFVLVLDDVHLLERADLGAALAELVEHVPPGSRIALASRAEPPLKIGRLRANRELVELGAPDLVMTRSEAAELLSDLGLSLAEDEIIRLVRRTEGWPAGIYLAGLALEGSDDVGASIVAFTGDDQLVADYLRDEFVASLDEDDREFLTRTSILDRLNGPLCDAVLEREGSAAILGRLSHSNLLLVPLDRTATDYRYHALLQEMLRAELAGDVNAYRAGLHERASDWYADASDFDRAIPHAIASGDRGRAGAMIWDVSGDFLSRGRLETIKSWLGRFSDRQLAESSSLALTMGNCALSDGDGSKVEHWTAAAERALANEAEADRPGLRAGIDLLRASGSARDGVVRMGADAARSAALLEETSPWRSLCCLIVGASAHLTGDRERARAQLEEGVRRGSVTAPHIEAITLAQLALLDLDEGDQEGAYEHAARGKAQADRTGLGDYPTSAFIYAVAALTDALRGRVDSATREARRAERLVGELDEFSPWFEAETRLALARTLLLLDDAEAAATNLRDAGRFARRTADASVLAEWIERIDRDLREATAAGGRWPLTKAELRLLTFLPTHLSFREIAEELVVSPNTVKTQARSIYQKLGVSSRAEAVATARTAGLVGITPE